MASTYKGALHLEQNLTADISLASTLPVKWTYFTATCDDNKTLLKWGTTNENNNSYFIIERSIDAIAWSPVAKMQGIGNSSVDLHYQFNDSVFSVKTYYRLRQVDFNGKADLSKTVAVNCESTVRGITLFPNPANNTLQLTGAKTGARYELLDAQGHAMKTGSIMNGNTKISLSGLPGGNYFLRVEGYKWLMQVVKAGP